MWAWSNYSLFWVQILSQIVWPFYSAQFPGHDLRLVLVLATFVLYICSESLFCTAETNVTFSPFFIPSEACVSHCCWGEQMVGNLSKCHAHLNCSVLEQTRERTKQALKYIMRSCNNNSAYQNLSFIWALACFLARGCCECQDTLAWILRLSLVFFPFVYSCWSQFLQLCFLLYRYLAVQWL